jgi:hypothetical protein
MQVAPRIVIIDDKKEHLDAIVSTFNSLGTTCYAIQYNAETGVPPGHLRGVRALFLDLHLLDGAQSGTDQRHFSRLSEILQNGIDPAGGPYVLVLWTTYPEKLADFRAFLENRLFGNMPHTRPVSFLALDKANYINVDSGDRRPDRDLLAAIKDTTESNPQLNALLAWERDVMAAAGSTLSTILDLIPIEHRGTAQGTIELDGILSLLAREQVGAGNVGADVRSAITTILAPILADRIINRDPAEGAQALWHAAVTRHAEKHLTPHPEQAASVNRMLHLSSGATEQLVPSDWGAVVDFPGVEWNAAGVTLRFGMSIKELLGNEFQIQKGSRAKVNPVLVRIGASCDHAQGSSGPLTYLFGIIRPISALRNQGEDGQDLPLKASLWTSPLLRCAGCDEPFRLEVNSRFPFVMNRHGAATLQVRFRLREQLLTHLLNHAGAYSVRPGVVAL